MTEVEIIPSSVLRTIEVRESGEKLVDLRIKCPQIAFKIAEYLNVDGLRPAEYEEAHFARETVAEMLNMAQTRLPKGLKLMIRCAYRTPEVQERQYRKDYDNLKAENPTWEKARLDVEIEKRTAPVDVAHHCAGSAIDLSIIDEEDNQLDMGTKLSEFGIRTYTHSSEISSESRANRQILIEAMEGAGFLNFPAEWWHWSYGDREWAYHNNQESFYGMIEQLT
jgi:D-alanyl-D-alanine dipeptidase